MRSRLATAWRCSRPACARSNWALATDNSPISTSSRACSISHWVAAPRSPAHSSFFRSAFRWATWASAARTCTRFSAAAFSFSARRRSTSSSSATSTLPSDTRAPSATLTSATWPGWTNFSITSALGRVTASMPSGSPATSPVAAIRRMVHAMLGAFIVSTFRPRLASIITAGRGSRKDLRDSGDMLRWISLARGPRRRYVYRAP